MPRNIESGPVQEEPEQQINLENNDTNREPTLKEKIAEAEKELNAFVQEHPRVALGSKDADKNDYLVRRLSTLREQELAQFNAEKIKQQTEMAKAKKELDEAYSRGGTRIDNRPRSERE